MYHNASILEQPIKYLENIWNNVVGFDYVALRDIHEDEEITIDYGIQWEEAWNTHLQNWVPPEGYAKFIPPQVLNADFTSPLRTYDEDKTMYSEHIDLYCAFSVESIDEEKDEWDEYELDSDMDHKIYRILERKTMKEEGKSGYFLYDLDLLVKVEGREKMMLYQVRNVPRMAISFYYGRYHSDMFVQGAFRHEMMIPDDIFPDPWRNI